MQPPQLVRIGKYTINLAHVVFIEETNSGFTVHLIPMAAGPSEITFGGDDARRLEQFLTDSDYVSDRRKGGAAPGFSRHSGQEPSAI